MDAAKSAARKIPEAVMKPLAKATSICSYGEILYAMSRKIKGPKEKTKEYISNNALRTVKFIPLPLFS
jgi:hypothetical protein